MATINAPRNAEQLAQRWNQRTSKAAFLNQIVTINAHCRLDTSSQIGQYHSSLTIAPEFAAVTFAEPRTGKFCLPWRIEDAQGNSPELRKISSSIIYLACTPQASTPRFGDESQGSIRPYPDMLFPRGILELMLPPEEVNSTIITIDLGGVDGFMIIEPHTGLAHPVWSPHT